MADPNYPSQSGSQELNSQQQAEQAQQAQYPHGYPPKPPTEQKTYQAYNPATDHAYHADPQAAVSSGALPSHEPQAGQTTFGANPNPLGANPVTSQFPPPPPPAPAPHSNETPLPEPTSHLQPAPAGVAHGASEGHRKKSWSTRMHELGTKAATPINALANKLGSQSFLPTTMDKECEKAASILLSFCKDGAHGEGHRPSSPTAPRSRSRDRAILKIPTKVLANAVGLAIFTTARVGFQFSASTGSGVLIARLPDRTWGPPSGIQVHALGAGFLAGADIYDCICVINTREALDAFTNTRVSLGPDLAVAAGPFGVGGKLDVGAGSGGHSQGKKAAEAEAADPSLLSANKERPAAAAHKRSSSYKAYGPVFTYVKSRGLFAGVQVDGTVITERKEANAAFYGEKIPASRILRGENVPAREAPALWPAGARPLHDALRRADSRPVGDEVIVPPSEATPAINDPNKGYGQGQGQGGQDPIPRSSDPKTGTVSGADAHKTTDELPGYQGAWAPSSAGDEKAPLPGSEAGVGSDVIPRAGDPKTGTVSGEHAHSTSDELPGYDGPKAPVQDQKPSTYQ